MQQCLQLLPLTLQLLLLVALISGQVRAVLASGTSYAQQQSQGSSQQAAARAGAGATVASTPASPAGPPTFCKLAGTRDAAYPNAAAATTMDWGGNMLKVYHNLYYHNKKWYALLDATSNASNIDAGMSLNAQLNKLPATDSEGFQNNIQVCYVPGVTLFIDFPFPAFPDNLGHWAELLLPTYSSLSSPSFHQLLQGRHKHIDRVLLLNVRQELLYNWPKEVLGLALEPAMAPWPSPPPAAATADSSGSSSSSGSGSSGSRGGSLGGAWYTSLPWERPLPPVIGPTDYDAWCAKGWLVFENLVVVQDRYPIISMLGRTLPKPPPPAEAAGVSLASAAAGDAATTVTATATDQQAAALTARKPGIEAGSEKVEEDDMELWSSKWVVGFNRPELAAKFRAAALARHLWDRPQKPLNHQPQQQQQQQKAQQQQGQDGQLQQQCEVDASGTCTAAESGAEPVETGEHSSHAGKTKGIPRMVTVLWYPEDYPPVANHRQLVGMLEDLTEPYGFKVRTVSLTMGAPFLSHLATMADTGILVGRHGPLLASAMLLPPGAAVLELLPYKWEWRGVSSLYHNMTQSTGQVHHWAWRPLDAHWCKYKEASHVRYAGWLAKECQGRDCLLVHAMAGLEVDLEAVRELLARKLPGLLAGHSVADLAEPWPPAD